MAALCPSVHHASSSCCGIDVDRRAWVRARLSVASDRHGRCHGPWPRGHCRVSAGASGERHFRIATDRRIKADPRPEASADVCHPARSASCRHGSAAKRRGGPLSKRQTGDVLVKIDVSGRRAQLSARTSPSYGSATPSTSTAPKAPPSPVLWSTSTPSKCRLTTHQKHRFWLNRQAQIISKSSSPSLR